MHSRHLLVVALLLLAACNDDGEDPSSLRTFDLDVTETFSPADPDGSALPDDWQHVEAVVIDAPEVVTAAESFDLVLELRNRSVDPIPLSPCPSWRAGMGESSENSYAVGPLPCDEIGEFGAGERIRLQMRMPATDNPTTGEGGEYVGLSWCLDGGFDICEDTRARIALPMK